MERLTDDILVKIPVSDNGEKLVKLESICPEIKTKHICYLRESVAERLCKAKKSLPEGYSLIVYEGYRLFSRQIQMYFSFHKKLKAKYPSWSHEKIKKENDKFVSPLDVVPPHSTGGAIDLTLAEPDGTEADMGTKILDFNENSATFSKNITKKAIANRKIFINALSGAGFVNYPAEWWHWSYGDRYWAAEKNKKYSIYNTQFLKI